MGCDFRCLTVVSQEEYEDISGCCGVRSPRGYTCTLPKEHTGCHVACCPNSHEDRDPGEHNIVEWIL